MSDSLPLSVHLRLEEVCARFEAAWQATGSDGSVPCLRDYLGDEDGSVRSALLHELIRLDLHY
jgi:hypothetical protein